MKTIALIEKGQDGTFGIYTPDINSTIIGNGRTVKEAKEDFINSYGEIVQAYQENEDKLPDELNNIEFEFRYDIASLFDYYDWINVSKFAQKAGINPSLLRQYKTKKMYISDNQISKIENALHSLGEEIAAIKL